MNSHGCLRCWAETNDPIYKKMLYLRWICESVDSLYWKSYYSLATSKLQHCPIPVPHQRTSRRSPELHLHWTTTGCNGLSDRRWLQQGQLSSLEIHWKWSNYWSQWLHNWDRTTVSTLATKVRLLDNKCKNLASTSGCRIIRMDQTKSNQQTAIASDAWWKTPISQGSLMCQVLVVFSTWADLILTKHPGSGHLWHQYVPAIIPSWP